MLISPFTPLFFTTPKSDGVASRYIQTFAPTDHILFEIFVPSPTYDLKIQALDSDFAGTISMQNVEIAGQYMCFSLITGLSNGIYQLEIRPAGIVSQPFRVTDDEAELENTTLIQYGMKDNKQRQDALFIIDGMRYFFDFRVPGGFKDSNWSFDVDNEQFVTPRADVVNLFSLESTQKQFTMGGQEGVPVWFGEMLNRILCCHYVYFDGVRYARKESSVPEMQVQIEGVDSFVFNQQVQQVNNLNPTIENNNLVLMRRVGTGYRKTDENINRII